MPKQTKPWKAKMNKGSLEPWEQQEEKKKQKTLDNWNKEKNG